MQIIIKNFILYLYIYIHITHICTLLTYYINIPRCSMYGIFTIHLPPKLPKYK